nr:MAG TPA: PURINE NUCLEOTIDE SYNTHESIS REPRESSOR/DNA COMPLEX REGULATION, DNA-BINDING, REPRESSOR, PURINE [Caudoviricetes sp.]
MKTITVGACLFKIVKKLENTYIVEKDNERYVYHKKKKCIVIPNYDVRAKVIPATVKTIKGRKQGDNYSLTRHLKLSERVLKVMDKRSDTKRMEFAVEIGVSITTLSTFLKNKKVNESTLDVIEAWLKKYE